MFNQETFSSLKTAVSEYRFADFDLSDKAIESAPDCFKGEMHLLRARLKVLTIDETVLSDCIKAAKLLPANSTVPSLFKAMPYANSSPVLLPTAPAKFRNFCENIKKSTEIIGEFAGIYDRNVCMLMDGEINYFLGNFDEAIALLTPLTSFFKDQSDNIRLMQAEHALMRCYLAKGQPSKAHKLILNVIRLSKIGAAEADMYKVWRLWINLTTGWSGDTPRFQTVPDGTVFPLLVDRAAAIQSGIAEYPSHEKAVLELANKWNEKTISLRDYYMQVYNQMVAFNASIASFDIAAIKQTFQIAYDTKLVQPIVEYGAQIIPLLEKLLDLDLFEKEWSDDLIARAKSYEKSLNLFRDEC